MLFFLLFCCDLKCLCFPITFAGAETDILPDLISMGALRFFDLVTVEFHTKNKAFKDAAWREKSRKVEQLVHYYNDLVPDVDIIELDDEIDRHTNHSLPQC